NGRAALPADAGPKGAPHSSSAPSFAIRVDAASAGARPLSSAALFPFGRTTPCGGGAGTVLSTFAALWLVWRACHREASPAIPPATIPSVITAAPATAATRQESVVPMRLQG